MLIEFVDQVAPFVTATGDVSAIEEVVMGICEGKKDHFVHLKKLIKDNNIEAAIQSIHIAIVEANLYTGKLDDKKYQQFRDNYTSTMLETMSKV